MKEFDVAVLGATGNAGQELTGILRGHPNVAGPQTPTREELQEFEGAEVVFSALRNGESSPHVARFRALGCTVIDLSDELWLPSPDLYGKWHPDRDAHPAPQLLGEKVPYGLPELNREELKPGTKLVAMPGCYPTPALLALMPPVESGLIRADRRLIINGESGYSGRGRDADNSDLIDEAGAGYNARPYKVGRAHQHVGEMERFIGEDRTLFVPEVQAIERGMLVKAYGELTVGATLEKVHASLTEKYEDQPFVSVLSAEEIPDLAETAGTDECRIGCIVVGRTVLLVGSIDNLRKGAASQAVQVFNLIQGLPEETGLSPKAGWAPAPAG